MPFVGHIPIAHKEFIITMMSKISGEGFERAEEGRPDHILQPEDQTQWLRTKKAECACVWQPASSTTGHSQRRGNTTWALQHLSNKWQQRPGRHGMEAA